MPRRTAARMRHLRAEVDTRNELDTVAYQVQRTLDENAGGFPSTSAPARNCVR